jgi:hypothetical protein
MGTLTASLCRPPQCCEGTVARFELDALSVVSVDQFAAHVFESEGCESSTSQRDPQRPMILSRRNRSCQRHCGTTKQEVSNVLT